MSIENPWENSTNKISKPPELQTQYNEIEVGLDEEMIVKRQVGPASGEEPVTINRPGIGIESSDFVHSQNIFNSLSEAEKQAISQEVERNLRGISSSEYQKEYKKELQKIVDEQFPPQELN